MKVSELSYASAIRGGTSPILASVLHKSRTTFPREVHCPLLAHSLMCLGKARFLCSSYSVMLLAVDIA